MEVSGGGVREAGRRKMSMDGRGGGGDVRPEGGGGSGRGEGGSGYRPWG